MDHPVTEGTVETIHLRSPPRTLLALGGELSRRVRPTIPLWGRTWPAFGVFVCAGVVLGVGATVLLATWQGSPPLLVVALLATGLASALALAYATRAVTGTERFTFHHYQLVVLGAGAALLGAWGKPVLAGLDLLAVALATTQAVGRLGCLHAGCCHGRPARWGVRYGDDHASEGFPRGLVGVPLLPVQAIESAALALLALASAALVAGGNAPQGPTPGSALTLYLAGYYVVRFVLEGLRGDPRPHRAFLSGARWTALTVLAATTALGAVGVLPHGALGVGAGLAVLATLVILPLAARRKQGKGLLSGSHVTEVAIHLSRLLALARRDAPPPLEVTTTSRGLHLSTQELAAGDRACRLVSLSVADGTLAPSTALRVARHVLLNADAGPTGELMRGAHGVWHLLASVP